MIRQPRSANFLLEVGCGENSEKITHKKYFIYGGVKVSTGILNCDKRVAVRYRLKSRNFKQ